VIPLISPLASLPKEVFEAAALILVAHKQLFEEWH
jgi:hypothetical protein